jgi:hypothetical protein
MAFTSKERSENDLPILDVALLASPKDTVFSHASQMLPRLAPADGRKSVCFFIPFAIGTPSQQHCPEPDRGMRGRPQTDRQPVDLVRLSHADSAYSYARISNNNVR